MRQALGAWAYTRGAGEARPSAADVRSAVGVAAAIVERAMRSRWGDAASGSWPSWRTAVPEDLGDLGVRTGLAALEVRAALELLAAAGAIVRHSGAEASVRVSDDVMAPAPAAAQLDWDACRERLARVGGSLPPALAVLRELACEAGAIADPAEAPSVRASVRDLEDRTAFGRSTVAEALGALERAGLLAVAVRAGRTTRFTLRPAAFGLPQPDAPFARRQLRPDPDLERGESPPGSLTSGNPGAGRSRAAMGTPQTAASTPGDVHRAVPTPSEGVVLLGEFAGTPIYAPPGTPLIIECDATGRWTCRVGPLLRLGPATESQ